MYYPETREGMDELKRAVSAVHAQTVMERVRKTDIPARQKARLLDAVAAKAASKSEE